MTDPYCLNPTTMARKRRRVDVEDSPAPKSTATSAQDDTQKSRRNASVCGRRGGLQDFPKMPLDILYEVFANLEPLDLLHLARTSKDFRALLMSRSSVFLWESARRNMGHMPDCPPYLSEPAYANLMFDVRCHGCLKATMRARIQWKFSVRYCKGCKHSWIVPLQGSTDTPISRVLFNYYHMPDEEKAQKIYKSLKNAQEREEYVIAQKAQWKVVDKHSTLCDHWLHMWYLSAKEAAKTQQSRLDAIVNKLRELGWEKELSVLAQSDYTLLRDLPCVRLAKPLTNRSWSVIKKPIIELLETHKADLLFKARVNLLVTRFTSLWAARRRLSQEVDGDIFPLPHDLALLPEVRTIIDVPDDVVVDETSFEVLQNSISSIIEHWLSEKKTFIEELIERETPEDPLRSQSDTATRTPLPLDLALSLGLYCSACKKQLTFPAVMYHSCDALISKSQTNTDEYATALVQNTSDDFWSYHCPLNFDYLRVDTESVMSVLVACGQDPYRVTLSQMDELDARLTCGRCHRKGELKVMTWRVALRHECRYRKTEKWILVTEQDASAAKELEEVTAEEVKERNMSTTPLRGCWSCGHCHRLQDHIQFHHKSYDEGLTKADVWYDPDREEVPRPVCLVSETRARKESWFDLHLKRIIRLGQGKNYEYTTEVPSDSDGGVWRKYGVIDQE